MPVAPSSATEPSTVSERVVESLAAAGWRTRSRPGVPGGLLARDPSGVECTVDVVTVPGEHGARAALVEHLQGLAAGEEHLVAVRAVVETGDGRLAVLRDHVDGLRLDELAAARGPFEAGEAVTVLVPVAQALAALHRTGRVHGALDARSVVVSPDGRAAVRPPLVPYDGTAPDDVRDLARLVLGLVPPPASSHPTSATAPAGTAEAEALAALHRELVVALREDPAARPAAGTFAARCYDAVEPSPVAMPDPARLVAAALGGRRRSAGPGARGQTAVPSRAASRGARSGAGTPRRGGGAARSVLTAAGVLAGCAVLVAVLLQVTGTPEVGGQEGRSAATGAVSDPTTDRGDPLGAARELTVRHLALVTGGGGDLAAVVVPGSPAETSEQGLLAELEDTVVLDAEVEVFDARHAVSRASPSPTPGPTSRPPDEAHVEVDYAVGAHRQRTPDGEVQVAATPRATVALVLRWTAQGWRVAEVRL
ncbi:hypothetical protein [Cellulosimicrobium sp. Marseille-Q8652]